MRYIFAILILLTTPAVAQEKPDNPQPSVKVNLVDDRTGQHVQMTLRVPHRTADRAWWAWTIASAGLTVADVENTQYCLRDPRCAEANPIYGSPRPSRGRQYAISGPIFAWTAWMSYREKRRQDAAAAFGASTSWDAHWYNFSLPNIGYHVFGLVTTIAGTRR